MILEKEWHNTYTDIEREIERLRQFMTDLPFSSDFGPEMYNARQRIAMLETRIREQADETLQNLEGILIMVAEARRDLKKDRSRLLCMIQDLRILRNNRCHANHVYYVEIQKAREDAKTEKGGEV